MCLRVYLSCAHLQPQTHLRTLFPNVFKALSTRWKMWRIQRLALKGDEKALDITKEMIGEVCVCVYNP